MRRRIVLLCLLFPALFPLAAQVEFVHLSDTHVVLWEGVPPLTALASVYLQPVSGALRAAVERWNADPALDFVLHTGDAIHGLTFAGAAAAPPRAQLDFFASLMAACRKPVYLALGNHDLKSNYRVVAGSASLEGAFVETAQARLDWRSAVPSLRDGTYYEFTRRAGSTEYLFLVLDNGERGAGADQSVWRRQAAWIRSTAAAHPGAKIVLVSHIPLTAADPLVRDGLGADIRPVLALAGHQHTNGFETIALPAGGFTQVRTAAFYLPGFPTRRIKLLPDRIDIHAPGVDTPVEKQIPLASSRP